MDDIEWSEHHIERIRTEVVCRHHNPILVLDGKDGRASDNGLSKHRLGMSDIRSGREEHTVYAA